MAKLENDPYDILEQEQISKKLLSKNALKALDLFDQAKRLFEKRPTSAEFKEAAERAGKTTCNLIIKEVTRIQGELQNEETQSQKKQQKKSQSKKIIEKSEKTLDDLDLCRQRLREDRKRKLESGEIQAPKRKTLSTRLRIELVQMAGLIPKTLRDDPDIIARTQKAILRFLNELKEIWGINKVKPITDEIREKFRKLEEAAIKPRNFRDN